MTTQIDRLMAVMDCAFDPRFGEAWTRRQVEDALAAGNCDYFLISASGLPICPDDGEGEQEMAGFYLFRQILTDTELLLLAVDPAFRRRGLGRMLLRHLVTEAQSKGATRIFLEMRRGNPAELLYRNFGFEPVGERRNYYRTRDGQRVDAITLRCLYEQILMLFSLVR